MQFSKLWQCHMCLSLKTLLPLLEQVVHLGLNIDRCAMNGDAYSPLTHNVHLHDTDGLMKKAWDDAGLSLCMSDSTQQWCDI